MKNFIVLLFVSLISFSANAQLKTPAPSPFCKMEQTVGLTDITLEYSRPSMKGRKIFAADGLVPFGKRWRTGANAATKISFSSDIKVEGQELKKGTYALLSTPNEMSWDIHFFNFEGSYPGDYAESEPALTVSVKPQMMPEGSDIESFMILVGDLTNNTATLEILWANVYVPIKLDVGTDTAVLASIDNIMSGPSYNDYYSAARFYRESGQDLNKALEWMNMSIEKRGEEKFWVLRQKSLIQADLKDYKGAVETAKKSLALATEAGNNDYVKMNNDSIAEWSSMMK